MPGVRRRKFAAVWVCCIQHKVLSIQYTIELTSQLVGGLTEDYGQTDTWQKPIRSYAQVSAVCLYTRTGSYIGNKIIHGHLASWDGRSRPRNVTIILRNSLWCKSFSELRPIQHSGFLIRWHTPSNPSPGEPFHQHGHQYRTYSFFLFFIYNNLANGKDT